ncbi:MCE family protein [Nocardia ninae]|uniref:Putative Mce family protein n=1 Tax=Nocardia ninae NBRC 108245 TaxID=1210091 RepID=A0A511M5T3_9NOCA|nr:MCE family protein [Nocardia ninae]GEM36004.1 putative Mce family protein [Nocardia ninae NBRC 108245]
MSAELVVQTLEHANPESAQTDRARRRVRTTLRALAAIVAVTVISGCGLTVQKLPLPMPGMSGETYTVHAIFEDALSLADQAKVRIGGSNVGVVTKISTKNFRAIVDLTISTDVDLPEGSTAELRQDTPLGEMFVAVSTPTTRPGAPMLRDGATLGLDKTSSAASAEQLLISISLLFNGGGVAALAELASELDAVVGGRGGQLSHLITEMTGVVRSLNDNSARVDAVLAEFGTLAGSIEVRHAELGRVAGALPEMLGTLAENNRAIGDLLTKVSVTSAALGDYADTTGRHLADLLDNTRRLMGELAAAGDDLGTMLDLMHTLRLRLDTAVRGKSIGIFFTVTALDVSVLTDPHGQLLPDAQDFVGSLIQVLQLVQSRVQGGHR